MRVTIGTARGVVEERDGNSVVIEGPIAFESSISLSGEIVTSATATVTKNRTLVASTVNCVLTLPDVVASDRQEFKIKKTSSETHSLTVAPVSGQTIDGQSSLTITAQNTAITLYALDGAWYIF